MVGDRSGQVPVRTPVIRVAHVAGHVMEALPDPPSSCWSVAGQTSCLEERGLSGGKGRREGASDGRLDFREERKQNEQGLTCRKQGSVSLM